MSIERGCNAEGRRFQYNPATFPGAQPFDMKIIFSRKGFDSSAGGAPSPIIDGKPVSLPIPTQHRSETTYADLGLAEIVQTATKSRISGDSLCHHDPMFEGGRCAFGQTGAAQGHLANNAVGIGDVFLFFGLFAEPDRRGKHHRFFGYLSVEEMKGLGSHPSEDDQPQGFTRRHPHTLGEWKNHNMLYVGSGQVCEEAHEDLRLSWPEGPVSRWRVPSWLQEVGLTYHARADRWEGVDTLNVVHRGQEFVADVADRQDARLWLETIQRRITSARHAEVD